MLTSIKNAVIINKNARKLISRKYQKFVFFMLLLFSSKFVGIVFVSLTPATISSHVITESSLMFAKYLTFCY